MAVCKLIHSAYKVYVTCLTRPTQNSFSLFLGTVKYYTEFLKDAASFTSPLQRLLRQGTPWIWGEQQQQQLAMNTIHQRLGDLPTLFTFLPSRQTIVTTDASGDGLGATLSQVQNGREVPIT